jgi:hypothetical protein
MARLDVWRCGVVHLRLHLLLNHRQDGLVEVSSYLDEALSVHQKNMSGVELQNTSCGFKGCNVAYGIMLISPIWSFSF